MSLAAATPNSTFLSTDDTVVLLSELAVACFILFLLLALVGSALSGVLGIAAALNPSGLPQLKEAADWMMAAPSVEREFCTTEVPWYVNFHVYVYKMGR